MQKSADDSPRKKGDNVIYDGKADGLPQGFMNALSQNSSAMAYFSGLTQDMKKSVIDQTHTITSKSQMRQFVDSLVPQIQGF